MRAHGFPRDEREEACWIQRVIRGIAGEAGRSAELQAVGRDITALKKAEEALRQANLVVESSPVVLIRWSGASGWPVEYVSANVIQFGYTPEELLTGETPYLALLHPDDLERVAREVQQYSASGTEHYRQEYRLVTKDGGVRWVDDRTAVERDAGGRVTHYQGILIDITEQKRAEDDLRQSRRFLETVLEHSPISMWVSDGAGTLLRMNQACRDLLSVTDEDLVGKYNLFHDNIVEQQGAMPLVRRVFERGERVQFVLRYDSAQLEAPHLAHTIQLVLEVTISPVLDPQGRVAHAIVQHQDITERTRAQEALARVNRQLRMLSDCNQALIRATGESELLSTVCTIVVQTGGYRMAWVGYAEEDEARIVRPMAHAGHEDGYLDAACVTWDDSERGRCPVGTAIRTRRACAVQDIASDLAFMPWRNEAMKRGYASVCALPIITGDHVLGALGVYSAEPDTFDPEEVAHLSELAGDLAFGIAALRARTERERAEETLRASDERFRRLALNSNDIIAVTDKDGLQLSVTGSVEKTLGFRPEELLGVNGFDPVHPDDAEDARAAFADCVRLPGSVRRAEYRYRHKNGGWVWLEAVGTNLIDDAVVRGVVMNIRDISERKNAEEERSALQNQLQQAMKMEAVGRLAGGVAHDFNNLLTAISGNIELAKMELAPADPLMHYLDEVSTAAGSAAALIRQLLAFSRRQIIEPRALNLNDLVDDLRKMLARLIGEDIDLRFVPANDLGSVRVDAGQFEQVLVNLAVNARDAMPNGGTLLIETANADLDEEYCARHPHVTPGPFVLLAVSDTGHGMSDEVKQRLFEPFFTTKPMGSGTGLGLATIFGVVKQARGAIEVYSEVGLGTTFKIYLPKVPEPAERFVKATPPAWLPRGNETVMLVEDDASVRDLALLILKRLGYNVLLAANGGEAFMLAEKHRGRIDLLMTDVVMPGMNGRELAERLLRLHPEMKVLFSSGYTENVIVHHGVIDERVEFIGKPFSMQALAMKVRSVLERE